MKNLLILSLLTLIGEATVTVQINEEIPYIVTTDSGHKVKIERIQDVDHKLTDDYTKTSRPCPPFCIQPTHVAPDIKNIEELELLSFIKNQVANKTGVVVDARLKKWYELETIPSAINIPFPIIQNSSKAKIEKIFKLLGMEVKPNGQWDFTNAKELAIFCNGVWCEQSKHFIEGMIKHHYPKSKLFYYRSGFQGWKLLGLTTVVHKEIKKR
jgi:hypothetical protein